MAASNTRVKRLRQGMIGLAAVGLAEGHPTTDLASLIDRPFAFAPRFKENEIYIAGRREIIKYCHAKGIPAPAETDTYYGTHNSVARYLMWTAKGPRGESFAKRYRVFAESLGKLPSRMYKAPSDADLAAIGQMATNFAVKPGQTQTFCQVKTGGALKEVCSNYGHPGGSCWGGSQINWFIERKGFALTFGTDAPVTRENGFARCWAWQVDPDAFVAFNGYIYKGSYEIGVIELIESAFAHLHPAVQVRVCGANNSSYIPGYMWLFGTKEAVKRLGTSLTLKLS